MGSFCSIFPVFSLMMLSVLNRLLIFSSICVFNAMPESRRGTCASGWSVHLQAVAQDDWTGSVWLCFREIPRRENAEVFSPKHIQFLEFEKSSLEVRGNGRLRDASVSYRCFQLIPLLKTPCDLPMPSSSRVPGAPALIPVQWGLPLCPFSGLSPPRGALSLRGQGRIHPMLISPSRWCSEWRGPQGSLPSQCRGFLSSHGGPSVGVQTELWCAIWADCAGVEGFLSGAGWWSSRVPARAWGTPWVPLPWVPQMTGRSWLTSVFLTPSTRQPKPPGWEKQRTATQAPCRLLLLKLDHIEPENGFT